LQVAMTQNDFFKREPVEDWRTVDLRFASNFRRFRSFIDFASNFCRFRTFIDFASYFRQLRTFIDFASDFRQLRTFIDSIEFASNFFRFRFCWTGLAFPFRRRRSGRRSFRATKFGLDSEILVAVGKVVDRSWWPSGLLC
jgi:hypothetical protein